MLKPIHPFRSQKASHLLFRLCVLLFLALPNQPEIKAQDILKPQVAFEAGFIGGYHFASNNVYKTGMSLNGPAMGIDLNYVQHGLKKNSFTEIFGKPECGITARILKMNNTDTFGYCLGIIPTYTLPILQSPKIKLGARIGYGINLNTQKFDDSSNFDNRAISSPINFGLDFSLRAVWEINPTIQLSANGGLYHVSNGSLQMPNGGINVLYAQLGLKYFPAANGDQVFAKTNYRLNFKPHMEYAIYGLGAYRELGYFHYITRFWVFGLSQQFTRKFNHLYSLGLGLDAYYDATQPLLYESALRVYDIAEKDKFYAALGLYQRFDIGKLFLPLGIYHYIYKMENVKEPVYLKFGLGFKPGKHLFYGLFFKGTINQKRQLQSDFMEWSIGWQL